MGIKIILTGATGFVGEGVLLSCLENEQVSQVLMINRRPFQLQHPRLKELIVPDFLQIAAYTNELQGYDACFYCAGISSAGMSEADYTRVTYDNTIAIAAALLQQNPGIVFNFVSGSHTDSTEKGKVMWARVKGRTENALKAMFPGRQYNFRPALMKPVKGQKNFRGYNRWTAKILFPVLNIFFPSCSIAEIAQAMINVTIDGYPKNILEVKDIKAAAV